MENKKIEYLVGKTSSLNNSISPFNELVHFLDELSLSLNLKNRNKKFVDVMALSFFVKKYSKIKKKYSDKSVRFGLVPCFTLHLQMFQPILHIHSFLVFYQVTQI